MKRVKDRDYLEGLLMVYAMMETEALDYGEHHHARRYEQACQAIDNMLALLPSGQ